MKDIAFEIAKALHVRGPRARAGHCSSINLPLYYCQHVDMCQKHAGPLRDQVLQMLVSQVRPAVVVCQTLFSSDCKDKVTYGEIEFVGLYRVIHFK